MWQHNRGTDFEPDNLCAQNDHLRQSYSGGQDYRATQDGVPPYVVRGFPSTAGTLGASSTAGGSSAYVVGSAPLGGYAGGNPAIAMYGGSAGGASVQVTPQQTPQLQAQAPLPRRSLTHPDLGVSNDGWDNENSDLILAVGDVLVNTSGDRCDVRTEVVCCVVGTHGMSVDTFCFRAWGLWRESPPMAASCLRLHLHGSNAAGCPGPEAMKRRGIHACALSPVSPMLQRMVG